MQDRLIRLSKYLAKYLRHSPHELGLTLQPGGWIPVDALLSAARKHGLVLDLESRDVSDAERLFCALVRFHREVKPVEGTENREPTASLNSANRTSVVPTAQATFSSR